MSPHVRSLPIVRVILSVKNSPMVAEFYQRHFGLKPLPSRQKGWLEITSGNGCNIAQHQAAKSHKSGAAMKIVFGVKDGLRFKQEPEADGLQFGPNHGGQDFAFANTKDPAGNLVQISSRSMK